MNDQQQADRLLFPRSLDEWLPRVDPPAPPQPPSLTSDQSPEPPKRDPDFLTDILGTDARGAAVMALNEPYLWEPEELALFENVIAGEDFSRDELIELVQSQIEGRREVQKKPKLEQQVIKAEFEDYDDEKLDPEPPPVREPSIQGLGTMGSLDVGNWWEEEPKK